MIQTYTTIFALVHACVLVGCGLPELPEPTDTGAEQYETEADALGMAHVQVDGVDDLQATSVTCWRKLFTPDRELHSFELLHDVWIWSGGHILAKTDPGATVVVVVVRYAEQ